MISKAFLSWSFAKSLVRPSCLAKNELDRRHAASEFCATPAITPYFGGDSGKKVNTFKV